MNKKDGAYLGLGALVALIIGACGSGGTSDVELPDNAVVADAPASSPPAPVKTKDGTIADGTWMVGKHIKAGTYRSAGGADSAFVYCSWSIKKGKQYEDAGSTGKQADPQEVALEKGQTFETTGCAVWVRQ